MNQDKYLTVLVWVGRGMSVLALFLPFGLFLGLVGIMATEMTGLLHRLVRSVEAGRDE